MDELIKTARRIRKTAMGDMPYKPDQYLRGMNNTVSRGFEEMKSILENFKKYAEDEDTSADYRRAMRDLPFSESELEFVIQQVGKLVSNIGRAEESYQHLPKSAVKNLASWLDDDYMRALHRMAKAMNEDTEDNLKYLSDGWDAGPEFAKQYRRMLALGKAISERVERAQEAMHNLLDGKPKAKDLEILYHTSVKARELAQNGFSEQRPDENFGLGGSSSNKEDSNSISFTYSQKYANDIARWLREMALIADQQVKPAQILRWSDLEGNADEFYKMMSGLVPLRAGNVMSNEGMHQLSRENGRWRVVCHKWDPKKNEVVTEIGDLDTIFQNPEAVYKMYEAYVATHPLRERVWVISPSAVIRRMREGGINPADIGVLAVEVDMTDPAISHHGGEREFRVPPRAVKRVVRLIGA